MDLESPEFIKQVSFWRDKASRIQRVITLAIAVGISLGCTQPWRSAQPKVVATDSEVTKISLPATDSIATLDLDLLSLSENDPNSPDPVTSVSSSNETQLALSEVEIMRFEALETAISDENFTPLTRYCHMGECIETYYTFTYLDQEINGERFYETEILTYKVPQGETLGRWNLQDAPTQVVCSTQRPMVIFVEGNQYLINNISPGTDMGGPFRESDALYWAICHDINITEYSNNQSRQDKALELGYSLDLPVSQTQQSVLNLRDN